MLGACYGRCSSTWTSRSPAPGPSSEARDTAAPASAMGWRSTPGATRRRAWVQSPRCSATRARARRGGLGRVHGGDRARHGRRLCRCPKLRCRARPRVGASRELLPLRGCAPHARGAAGARARDRPRLERAAGPGGVRRAPPARRGRRRRLQGPRPSEAAPSIFEAALSALGARADETAMVGDSAEDDIAGPGRSG